MEERVSLARLLYTHQSKDPTSLCPWPPWPIQRRVQQGTCHICQFARTRLSACGRSNSSREQVPGALLVVPNHQTRSSTSDAQCRCLHVSASGRAVSQLLRMRGCYSSWSMRGEILSDRAVQVRNLFKLTSGKAFLADICVHEFGDHARHLLSENWNVHN